MINEVQRVKRTMIIETLKIVEVKYFILYFPRSVADSMCGLRTCVTAIWSWASHVSPCLACLPYCPLCIVLNNVQSLTVSDICIRNYSLIRPCLTSFVSITRIERTSTTLQIHRFCDQWYSDVNLKASENIPIALKVSARLPPLF
jgi:hypothetical protein